MTSEQLQLLAQVERQKDEVLDQMARHIPTVLDRPYGTVEFVVKDGTVTEITVKYTRRPKND